VNFCQKKHTSPVMNCRSLSNPSTIDTPELVDAYLNEHRYRLVLYTQIVQDMSYDDTDEDGVDGSYLYFSPRASILCLASFKAHVWILVSGL